MGRTISNNKHHENEVTKLSRPTNVQGTPQIRNLMFTSSSYIFTAEIVSGESSSSSFMSATHGLTSMLGGTPRICGPSFPAPLWQLEGKTLLCIQYSLKDARASWKASHVWLDVLQMHNINN